jgi:hypothetical protein
MLDPSDTTDSDEPDRNLWMEELDDASGAPSLPSLPDLQTFLRSMSAELPFSRESQHTSNPTLIPKDQSEVAR